MTTQQMYGLFAMLTIAAFAGLIFYCVGLRAGKAAGYEQGHQVAKTYWKKILSDVRATLGEHRDLLTMRDREINTLRLNIEAESADHAKVERELLQKLASAIPLTDEDQDTLEQIAEELELASRFFAGIQSNNHASRSKQLALYALNMAQRLKAAQANKQSHPDSELIDFLADVAYVRGQVVELPEMYLTPSGNFRSCIRSYQASVERDVEMEEQEHAA